VTGLFSPRRAGSGFVKNLYWNNLKSVDRGIKEVYECRAPGRDHVRIKVKKEAGPPDWTWAIVEGALEAKIQHGAGFPQIDEDNEIQAEVNIREQINDMVNDDGLQEEEELHEEEEEE
jgi:hypothetical protein